MSDQEDWTEVIRSTPKTKTNTGESSSRNRVDSFGEIIEVPRIRMGRTEHRENKLEWSATKQRERKIRVEKRNVQRNASKPATPENED